MTRLRSLLKKIAEYKEGVQSRANFDKINLADDVKERSPLVTSVVARNSRIFVNQVLGEDISVMPEDVDLNRASSLAVQELVFTSVAENPAANLISLEIIADSAESISLSKKHIKIRINNGISNSDSVKALVDGSSRVTSLVSVAVNAGQGLVVVTAEDKDDFSGAL